MSELYAPTLKEDPAEADIASHKLLLRAGMIRRTASGIYTYLPLGQIVLRKIEQIVREEMDAIGAQEILMPALQPDDLWKESGRWDDYGPELMRLRDRHDHGFCLGPTHEELITALVRNELRSYKQLPVVLYQIQTKYRDEIRPRFGLLRSREFIMKDAYSFSTSQESLQEIYDRMGEAYGRICKRCGLEYRAVDADSGQIGGKVSTEFMALADSGEAELVTCPDCGYASDTEAAACISRPTSYGTDHMEKIETPGVHTIEDLAKFLKISESATVKAFIGADKDNKLVALFVPGNHEINEIKAGNLIEGFRPATDQEMEAAGLPKGSIGPVGLPAGIPVYADSNLKSVERWVVGANEDGYHYVGARQGEDFTVDVWADLCVAKAGDICPKCSAILESCRGIEVSQIFQLGDKYSRTMNATYLDKDGKEQYFLMGCYGVGISRTLAAVVEQHSDEDGIIWPVMLAPAQVIVIELNGDKDERVARVSESIMKGLQESNVDVAIDDRKERPGVKFADADLMGWPVQIIVGKRGLDNGTVEIKLRTTGERGDVSLSSIIEAKSLFFRQRESVHTYLSAMLRGEFDVSSNG
jgi:prolyl-tRNA synthetase